MPANEKELSKKSNARSTKTSQERTQKPQQAGQHTTLPYVDLPSELQQLALNSFRHGLSPNYNQLPEDIQQVKHYLYERDFLHAFSTESLREAYALRWSPSRALAYASIFHSVDPLKLKGLSASQAQSDGDTQNGIKRAVKSISHVVCIGGGGGAEVIGLVAYLYHAIHAKAPDRKKSDFPQLACTIVDLADWSSVHQKLVTLLDSEPSQPAQSEARSVIYAPNMTAQFRQVDVLECSDKDMEAQYQGVKLVTIMFTLNELYSTSTSKTTRLLLSLSYVLDEGALLLVVDSPGSYSTVGVGKDGQKKYPMQFLLDHTLLDSAADNSVDGKEKAARWEKLEGVESRWFRLAKGVDYPIDLEDMRYQFHLYRRL